MARDKRAQTNARFLATMICVFMLTLLVQTNVHVIAYSHAESNAQVIAHINSNTYASRNIQTYVRGLAVINCIPMLA